MKFLICLILFSFSFVGYQLAMNSNFEPNLNDDFSMARDFDLKNYDQLNNFRVVYIATNKVVRKNTASVEELNLTMDLWVDLFESFFIPLTIIWGFSCGFRY